MNITNLKTHAIEAFGCHPVLAEMFTLLDELASWRSVFRHQLKPTDAAGELLRLASELDKARQMLEEAERQRPVKEQPAVDVADICNAYESGVGHVGRKTALRNPYPEGTHVHEAYAIGASGTKT